MKNFNVKQSGSEVIPQKPKRYMLTGNEKIDEMNEENYLVAMSLYNRQMEEYNNHVHETPKSVHDLETCTEKEEKGTHVVINRHASDNNTWLAPYVGRNAKLIEHPNGELEILIEGENEALDATGGFVASNDWHYTIHDIVDRGETPIQEEETETCLHCSNTVKPNQCCSNCGGYEFMSKDISMKLSMLHSAIAELPLSMEKYQPINDMIMELKALVKVQEHKPESEETVAKSLTVYKKEVQDRMKRMEMQPEYINGHSQGFADCFNFLVMNGFEIKKKK